MTKVLRSLIHEKLPYDMRTEIEFLSRRRDISNAEKQGEVLKAFRKYDVPNVVPLGPGTNRFALKVEGFVLKVATDMEGKIDNWKEFTMSKILQPGCSRTYEVSENGTFVVAEYGNIFTAFDEMLKYQEPIEKIIEGYESMGYIVGDIGITNKNFANWALRVSTQKPICIDYAYIYNVHSNALVCRKCKNESMLVYTPDKSQLVCPICHQFTPFQDLRRRITRDDLMNEIGDLGDTGYKLLRSAVETELNPKISLYLKKKTAPKKQEEIVEEPHEYEVFNMKGDNIMSNDNGNVVSMAFARRIPSNPSTTPVKINPGNVIQATNVSSVEVEPEQDPFVFAPSEPIVSPPEHSTPMNTKFTFIGDEEQPEDEEPSMEPGQMIPNFGQGDTPNWAGDIPDMENSDYNDNGDEDEDENEEENEEDDGNEDGCVEIDVDGKVIHISVGEYTTFSIYPQKFADLAELTHSPINWNFLRHFQPFAFIESEFPILFCGASNTCETPIIPVDFGVVKGTQRHSIGIYFLTRFSIVDMSDHDNVSEEIQNMTYNIIQRVIENHLHEDSPFSAYKMNTNYDSEYYNDHLVDTDEFIKTASENEECVIVKEPDEIRRWISEYGSLIPYILFGNLEDETPEPFEMNKGAEKEAAVDETEDDMEDAALDIIGENSSPIEIKEKPKVVVGTSNKTTIHPVKPNILDPNNVQNGAVLRPMIRAK